MEYHLLKTLHKFSIPRWIRNIIGVTLLGIGLLSMLIPVIPGLPIAIVGLVFLIDAKKVRKVIQIRKGFIHLFQNFSKERLVHKYQDLKKHLKAIFHKH